MSQGAIASIAHHARVVSGSWSPAQDRVTVWTGQNALFRAGLQHLLADTPFVVSNTAFDKTSLLSGHPDVAPVLVILDASCSSPQTAETVRHLKGQRPEARVVVIADQFDPGFIWQGRDAGIDGFCLAASGREVLIKSLELVMLGETVLPSSTLRLVLGRLSPGTEPQHRNSSMAGPKLPDPRAQKLSAREAEILKCLMAGESNKGIARKLGTAESTVKVHVKAILRKVGAANRTQAAMWATAHLPTRGALQHV